MAKLLTPIRIKKAILIENQDLKGDAHEPIDKGS